MVLKHVCRLLELVRVYGIFLLCPLLIVLVVWYSITPYCLCGLSCDFERPASLYPTGFVVLVPLLTIFEALVFFAIVRPPSGLPSWRQTVLALALFVSGTLLLNALVLVPPWTPDLLLFDFPWWGYYLVRIFWLFLVVWIFGVILVVMLGGLVFDVLRRLPVGRVAP